MSDPPRGEWPDEPPDAGGDGRDDPSADTDRFEAFVRGGDDRGEEGDVQPAASRTPFRVVTLLVGLVILAVLVWLLLGI